jgi:hypothetical protein
VGVGSAIKIRKSIVALRAIVVVVVVMVRRVALSCVWPGAVRSSACENVGFEKLEYLWCSA